MPDGPIIGIVGPIGAGKSTIAHALSEVLDVPVQQERVDDNPFFERFCAQPETWAFHSQLSFMLGAMEAALDLRRAGAGGVLERPIAEMFGVFVTDQLQRQVISRDEYDTLARLRDVSAATAGEPDAYVFLMGDPRILIERIRGRGRTGEEAYDLAYLQQLDARYRAWHGELRRAARVVTVDVVERDLRSRAEVAVLADELRALG